MLPKLKQVTVAGDDGIGASGERASSDGKADLPLRYPGQQYDAESGLHYSYFRDYEPGTGRYVEPDPLINSEDANEYAYAGSSPLYAVDVLGMETMPGSGKPKSYPKCIKWPKCPSPCRPQCAEDCAVKQAEERKNCFRDCKSWYNPFPQAIIAMCSESMGEWSRQCLDNCTATKDCNACL